MDLTTLSWPLLILLGAIGLYALTALASGLLHRSRNALALVYPASLLAAILAAGADLWALLANRHESITLPMGLPVIGLHLDFDALAAFFGLIINGGVAAAAIYGLGLSRDQDLSPRIEPFFAAFAAAMNLVLLAGDAFSFLFFWELMSLASWALVVSRHEDAEARQAGHLYLIMAAMGTSALLFAFGTLAGASGNYAFAAMRSTSFSPLTTAVVLGMTLIGAGSKAGIVPLHAWLPLAHPAAPSHVSALMSGVMTKVAIYAVIRVVFDLLGQPLWWWALPFLILGAATAVLGLLYAVMDCDLKRVLAYSTVENIGIIFVGLGLTLAFKSGGYNAAAAVALAASLLHALNHSWFKSLLFLGAGAVLHATGRRTFDHLGGLIHRMPVTAALFLVGTMSISALPPFNGFVSEWLLFQAVLAGPVLPEPVLRFMSPAVGAMLALAAALAAATFVRAFGITFLGRARSGQAAVAHETNRPQLIAMALLALLCLYGGLFGDITVSLLQPLLQRLAGSELPGTGTGPTYLSLVAFSVDRSIYDAPTIATFLLISGTLTSMLVHWVSGRKTRRAPAWDCGFPDPSPMTQYTAASLSQPIRRVYGSSVFGVREEITMPPPGDMAPARLHVRFIDHIWQRLYASPATAVLRLSERLNTIQFLSIRANLMMMFSALIILLLLAVMWL